MKFTKSAFCYKRTNNNITYNINCSLIVISGANVRFHRSPLNTIIVLINIIYYIMCSL